MNFALPSFSPGAYLAPAVDWLNTNFHPFFDAVARLIEAVLSAIEAALLYPPAIVTIVVAVALAFFLVGIRVAVVAAIALIMSFVTAVGVVIAMLFGVKLHG